MPNIDKVRVDNVDYDIGGGETLPVGTEVDFDGQASDIPAGWEEVEDKGEVYSTDEVRIGTWIDNRPIYRRVVFVDSLKTLASNTWVSLQIPINEIDFFIKDAEAIAPFNGAVNIFGIRKNNNYIELLNYRSANYSLNTDYPITIEYTKTTDTVQGGNS